MDNFGKAVVAIVLSAVLAILVVRAAEEIRGAVNQARASPQSEATEVVTSPD